MTHESSSCKTCDWCGELEPESGTFSRTGDRYHDTVLCPDCAPDDEVEKGLFLVYDFTMHLQDNTVIESFETYMEASSVEMEYWLVVDTGLGASGDGHVRCKLVLSLNDGLSHGRMKRLLNAKAVIDSANADPERNNCRVKFYNYNVKEVVLNPEHDIHTEKEPKVIATNTE